MKKAISVILVLVMILSLNVGMNEVMAEEIPYDDSLMRPSFRTSKKTVKVGDDLIVYIDDFGFDIPESDNRGGVLNFTINIPGFEYYGGKVAEFQKMIVPPFEGSDKNTKEVEIALGAMFDRVKFYEGDPVGRIRSSERYMPDITIGQEGIMTRDDLNRMVEKDREENIVSSEYPYSYFINVTGKGSNPVFTLKSTGPIEIHYKIVDGPVFDDNPFLEVSTFAGLDDISWYRGDRGNADKISKYEMDPLFLFINSSEARLEVDESSSLEAGNTIKTRVVVDNASDFIVNNNIFVGVEIEELGYMTDDILIFPYGDDGYLKKGEAIELEFDIEIPEDFEGDSITLKPYSYTTTEDKDEARAVKEERRYFDSVVFNKAIPTKGVLVINKVDNETNKPLSGAEFVIKNNQGEELSLLTDDMGRGELELDFGEYILEESKAPAGYIKTGDKIKFKLSEDNILVEKTIKNSKSSDINMDPGRPISPIERPTSPEIDFPRLNRVDHMKYIYGYGNKKVKPNSSLTREEASAVLYRILNDDYRETIEYSRNGFEDVKDSRWSNNYISTLSNAKILEGYKDGKFRPENRITRAELITMLVRLDYNENVDNISKVMPKDIEGHWAEKYIVKAYENDLLLGYKDGTFKPDQYMTRAEFVTFINRVLERNIENQKILDGIEVFDDLVEDSWYYNDMVEAINGHEFDIVNGIKVWTKISK